MPRLLASDDEALNLLQEECAEIIQIISKIRRFGFDGYHPNDSLRSTNIELLHSEMGDYEAIKRILIDRLIVGDDIINTHADRKVEKLRKYTTLF